MSIVQVLGRPPSNYCMLDRTEARPLHSCTTQGTVPSETVFHLGNTQLSTMVCTQYGGTEMPQLRFPMRCSRLRAKAAVPNCFVSHPHPHSLAHLTDSPRLRAPGPAYSLPTVAIHESLQTLRKLLIIRHRLYCAKQPFFRYRVTSHSFAATRSRTYLSATQYTIPHGTRKKRSSEKCRPLGCGSDF